MNANTLSHQYTTIAICNQKIRGFLFCLCFRILHFHTQVKMSNSRFKIYITKISEEQSGK